MKEIGQRLRERRLELGLSLSEAEAVTKIRKKYLEALETGDVTRIPGEVYVKGFLRAYGEYLGLDGWELVRRFREEQGGGEGGGEDRWRLRLRRPSADGPPGLGPMSGASQAVSPTASARRSGPGLGRTLLVIAMAVVLVTGAGVWYVWDSAVPSVGDSPPVSDGGGDGSGSGGGQPLDPTGDDEPSGDGGSGDGGGPGTGGSGSDGDGTPPLPGIDEWRLASESDGRVAYVVYGAPFEVGLKVNDRCWVRVIADGQTILEEILEAGSLGRWSARQRLTVIVGRASMVEVSLEGTSLGPAGPADDARTLTFEAGDPAGGGTG